VCKARVQSPCAKPGALTSCRVRKEKISARALLRDPFLRFTRPSSWPGLLLHPIHPPPPLLYTKLASVEVKVQDYSKGYVSEVGCIGLLGVCMVDGDTVKTGRLVYCRCKPALLSSWATEEEE